MSRTRKTSGRRAAGASRRRPKPRATAKAGSRRAAAKTAKRTPRKATAKRGVRKSTAAARARPAAARTRTPRRPVALLRPAQAPAVTAFPQRAGASSKQEVLFELVRARVGVHAAMQGLEAGGTAEPIAAGKWSVLEHALHMVHRDHEVTQAMDAALRGSAPRWAGFDSAATDRFNAEGVESLRHLSWEEARRALLTARLRLIEEIEAVPEEPGEVWSAEHPFGAMLREIAENDRHHAEIIKRWRGTRGA